MRRAIRPAICLKTTVGLAFDGDDVLLVLLGRVCAHGVEELAALVAYSRITPAIGERFTCTSKTLRKMLMR